MNNSALFFSNMDYYKNPNFQYLMRNWNKYLEYDGDELNNDGVMAEWEEILLKDFLRYAREWLWNNMAGEQSWRRGLE